MQRPRKSPRQLQREIDDALRGAPRSRVAGYSNYGGGGPFAPMAAPASPVRTSGRPQPRKPPRKPPPRAHATKAGTAKAGPSDRVTIDQLAKLLGLPDWEKVDEMNQQHYWEMSRGDHEDEDAQMKAEQEAQDEVYRRWYDAVESTANNLLGEHGLELLAMKHTRKVHPNYRPHTLKIVPFKSWTDAADKLRETINGVGDFHFDTLGEFLDSGPYTARQAVLAHLGYIKRYPHVYGGLGANQMYDQAWR